MQCLLYVRQLICAMCAVLPGCFVTAVLLVVQFVHPYFIIVHMCIDPVLQVLPNFCIH